MSSELERRIQERLPGLPMTFSTKRELRKVFAETGIEIIKTDAAASVTKNAMQNISDLVDEARKLAGDDPVKAGLVLRLVTDYADRNRAADRSTLGW